MNKPSQPLLDIDQFHASAFRGAIYLTGGGSGLMERLLSIPGASQTLLDGQLPYSPAALASLLNFEIEKFATAETASHMAMAAWQRAIALDSRQGNSADTIADLFGLAATASLASQKPKRGQHRLYIALQTLAASLHIEIIFNAKQRSHGNAARAEEETLCTQCLLATLATLAELKVLAQAQHSRVLKGDEHQADEVDAFCRPLTAKMQTFLASDDRVKARLLIAPQPWQALYLPTLAKLIYSGLGPSNEQPPTATNNKQAILPGSFNPLHRGHQIMAAKANKILGLPVDFELAITNVDKPSLDYFQIHQRGQQFNHAVESSIESSIESSVKSSVKSSVESSKAGTAANHIRPSATADEPKAPSTNAMHRLWLTNADRFQKKARLFPNTVFVVGIDTLARIGDPRYYQQSETQMMSAIAEIRDQACRFLAFGRLHQNRFQTWQDLNLPTMLAEITSGVDEKAFREDISSTEIRTQS